MLSLAGGARGVGGLLHGLDRLAHDGAIETELPAVVVVHAGDIGSRPPADLADGHLLEATLCKQLLRSRQQALAGLARFGHSVRLKSLVAADIAMTEKTSRNPRS